MTARVTIERVLRDDEDASGQSVRKWKIEAEAGHVVVRLDHGDGFILIRLEDVEMFCADVRRAMSVAMAFRDEGAA